jgi:hypothetical protein
VGRFERCVAPSGDFVRFEFHVVDVSRLLLHVVVVVIAVSDRGFGSVVEIDPAVSLLFGHVAPLGHLPLFADYLRLGVFHVLLYRLVDRVLVDLLVLQFFHFLETVLPVLQIPLLGLFQVAGTDEFEATVATVRLDQLELHPW